MLTMRSVRDSKLWGSPGQIVIYHFRGVGKFSRSDQAAGGNSDGIAIQAERPGNLTKGPPNVRGIGRAIEGRALEMSVTGEKSK